MFGGEALLLCFLLIGASGFGSRILDVSLLNEGGKDTCTHLEPVASCVVSPSHEVTLRFNLLVDVPISNQKLEVYFNGVLLQSEYVCYDSRSRNILISPNKFPDDCTIPKSTAPYNVEMVFSVPEFQVSAELSFHVGDANGILVILSGKQPLPLLPSLTKSLSTPGATTTEEPPPELEPNPDYGVWPDPHMDFPDYPKPYHPPPQ